MYTAAKWPPAGVGLMRLQGKAYASLQDFSHMGGPGLNKRKQTGIYLVCIVSSLEVMFFRT
jgi:hypothetical protein